MYQMGKEKEPHEDNNNGSRYFIPGETCYKKEKDKYLDKTDKYRLLPLGYSKVQPQRWSPEMRAKRFDELHSKKG